MIRMAELASHFIEDINVDAANMWPILVNRYSFLTNFKNCREFAASASQNEPYYYSLLCNAYQKDDNVAVLLLLLMKKRLLGVAARIKCRIWIDDTVEFVFCEFLLALREKEKKEKYIFPPPTPNAAIYATFRRIGNSNYCFTLFKKSHKTFIESANILSSRATSNDSTEIVAHKSLTDILQENMTEKEYHALLCKHNYAAYPDDIKLSKWSINYRERQAHAKATRILKNYRHELGL